MKSECMPMEFKAELQDEFPDNHPIKEEKSSHTLRKEAEEEYNRVKQEQTYKRLMHLLDQSQFFAKFIIEKVEHNPNTTKKKKESKKRKQNNKRSRSPASSNVSPAAKRPRRAVVKNKRYDLSELGSDDIQKKVKDTRRKMNLSQEDIENELNISSDSELVPQENSNFLPLKYFEGDLYEYQKEGVNWMKVLYENGLNGMLADEMGLGKTIQVIALLAYLIEKKQPGPFLIIVPLSTVPNWLMEFEKFAPKLPVVLYYGSSTERAEAAKKMNKKYSVDGFQTQPIILTTYEVPIRDIKIFRKHTWSYIIIDEGQRIKNYKCQLVQRLEQLKSLNRLLLTGTPLQNDLTELWSLLHFLLPDIFDDLDVFESWFDVRELQHAEGAQKVIDQEKDKQVVASMREILKPFMMRRMKKDVCIEIPEKKEILVYAPMTQLQRDLYSAAINRDLQALHKVHIEPLILDDENGKRPTRKCRTRNKFSDNYSNPYDVINNTSWQAEDPDNDNDEFRDYRAPKAIEMASESNEKSKTEVIDSWKQYADVNSRNAEFFLHLAFGNRIMMYREIVNHPYLIHCPLDDGGLPAINEDLVKNSGKLMVLDAMLKRLHADGHKVLLFSTLTMILDIISDYLNLRSWKSVRLDGRVKIEQRKEAIHQFNTDDDIFLFLISTRAGGVGLNLAAADTVIIFDSDWNPQADIQAMARCHRIGQTRPVVVYRLCTKATVDESIVKRAEAKRKLEKMVINKDIALNLNNQETLLELKKLLDSTDSSKVTLADKEGNIFNNVVNFF